MMKKGIICHEENDKRSIITYYWWTQSIAKTQQQGLKCSFKHILISSSHAVILAYSQIVILSLSYRVKYCYIVIFQHCHIVKFQLSQCQIVKFPLSYCQMLKLLFCHILSNCQILSNVFKPDPHSLPSNSTPSSVLVFMLRS